jgi:SHS2 domain-containing protein
MSAVPSHEFVEHTGEVILFLQGPTLASLFEEAAKALGELMLDESNPPTTVPAPDIVVTASDRETLLAQWLNELIFRAETRQSLDTHVRVDRIDETCVLAKADAVPIVTLRTAVKAATFHRLAVTDEDGHFSATVLLDV